MNIYAILSTKPHNPHYLNKYIKFIQACQVKNIDYVGYTEKHHICPRASDLFPEYHCFKENPWNKAILTARQHLIAHLILCKVYPDSDTQKYSLFKMFHGRSYLKNYSRIYEKAKLYNSELTRKRHYEEVENNIHPWQGDRNPSRIASKEGRHHAKEPEWRRRKSEELKRKVEDGTHPWQGDKNLLRIAAKEGRHPWQGGEHQRKVARQKIKDGTHNWLGGEQQKELNKKRIDEGTHNWVNETICIDMDGNTVSVSREEYRNQKIGKPETWKYVHYNSKEGHRRRGVPYINRRCKNKVNDQLS